MNVVISKNSYLKEKIEEFLSLKDKNVIVLLKSNNIQEIFDSIDKFYLSNQDSFEDKNICIMYITALIAKGEEYKNLIKKDFLCLSIREKLCKINHFLLD